MENKTIVERLREYSNGETISFWGTVVDNPGQKTTQEIVGEIADAIEAEYLPRPRFEDGEVVQVGDKFVRNSTAESTKEIDSYYVYDNGDFTLIDRSKQGHYPYREGEHVKRPEPPVLDADGVFTHKQPDTQECINEDALKDSGNYWGCKFECCNDQTCPALIDGKMPKDFYGVDYCLDAKVFDLLAREKKLYERKAK